MYGEKEVKAEVKLAFQSLSGNSMVSTRTMQVIAKKTGNTFKSLEGQLLQLNRGERTTISTKCAELESLVPRNLGTPRPILDYVIFCHQEDSLWPLSEPANLKKRFDEIFEALKFTKALDNLKTIKKDMAVEIKLLDQSVKHLKQDKERADRTRERLEKNQSTIRSYEDESALFEAELGEVTKETDTLFKSNQAFQETISKLESLRNDQKSISAQLDRLQDSCKLLPDTDEDLSYKLTNFQTLIDESSTHVEKLKTQSKGIQRQLSELRQNQNILVGREGELKAKECKLQDDMSLRKQLVEQLVDEPESDISEERYSEYEQEAYRTANKKHKVLKDFQQKASTQEADLSKKAEENKNSQFKESQHKQYATTDRNDLESQIKSLQSRINDLGLSEGNLEYEKSALEDLETKLRSFNESKFFERTIQEAKAKNTQINAVETDIEDVARDISNAHQQSDIHAKISFMEDELRFKDNALQKLLQTNSERLMANDIELEKPLHSFSKKLQQLKISFVEEDRKLKALDLQKGAIEGAITYKKETLVQLERSIASASSHFKEQLGDEIIEEYEDIVLNAEEDYKVALENLKMRTTTLQFNKKALEVAQQSDSCYLCSRKFLERPVLQAFIDDLKRKTDSQLNSELQSQLDDAKNYIDKVRSVSSDVDKLLNTKDKLKDIKQVIATETQSLNDLQLSLAKQKEITVKLSEDVSNLESLRNSANEINRLQDDIEGIKRQLEMKQHELSNYGLSPKSLDDLQKTHQVLTASLRTLRRELSLVQEEKDSKQREFTILEGNVKDRRLIISDMERSLVERENLTRTIEDHQKKVANLTEAIEKATTVLSQLKKEEGIIIEGLHALGKKNSEQVRIYQTEYDEANTLFIKFQSLNKSAAEYVGSIKGELESLREQMQNVELEIVSQESTIEDLQETISSEELRLVDTSNEERNLRSNIDIRQMQERLVDLQREIKDLEAQNAEAQREKYQERSNQLREQYTNLTSELAGKRGEIRQIDDQIKLLQRELDTDFKDVEKNYREEWTKLQTRTVVSDDLVTYAKALDNAIMSYHSLKMKEINRIIDELWKSTYSGTDVDTIKIKSDPSTGKGNRSYNYRVVMYKQDAELDMRGRCSAGQKVLACIIIRLALSECFGTNCGVIALDEPTTNLDSDNIESLAHSLGNIIEMRRSQKNFQLIVITHDEKFLHSMGAARYTDHFFQLRRDESQNSRIELVDIAKVSV